MGNSLWCSASGERLASAARDGDLVEARMLLDLNPCLASYSTFAALNSPLHFAASRGHSEIVMLLLENGADVNGRNFCGQTALMQACRYGHWEVVQALLIFRSNVMKAEYLTGKTALHFAAAHGHIRCIRLLVADFVPNAPFGSTINSSGVKETNSEGPDSSLVIKNDQCSALSRFINKVADGGMTALHSAALNGHFDCVQLLLDLNAKVSAVTFHYGTSIKMIGAGSTPLHYASCGGNLKCCQILLAKGASRLSLNCNGWLPIDVARIWGHHYLQPLLAPNSDFKIPTFPLSSYLSLPLRSILNIARECKLQSSATVSDDSDLCAVCLERACSVAAEGCSHELCVRCALYLCSTGNMTSEMGPAGSIPCPLCRAGIVCFIKSPRIPSKSLSLCASCTHHPHELDSPLMTCTCRFQDCKNRIEAVSSALI